jgi:NAD-dependent DNA ligase
MLDQVPGVGKTRRTALLKHFHSVQEMKEKTVEELAKAPGMNKTVAAAVYAALHEEEADSNTETEDEEIPTNGTASAVAPISFQPKPSEEMFLATNVIGRNKQKWTSKGGRKR